MTMLAKLALTAALTNTLKKRADFLNVRKGTRLRGPFFVIDVKKRDADATAQEFGQARVGYTVTKRQGNAVERNRMKRRLRAIVKHHAKLLVPDHDYVITAQRDVLKTAFDRLDHEFANRTRKLQQKLLPPQLAQSYSH